MDMNFSNYFELFQYLLSTDENNMRENLHQKIDRKDPMFKKVLSLIVAHEANKEKTIFNELINKQAISLVDDDSIHQLEGQQFGYYKLVEKLGFGGMGVVYLGKRNDGQLEQSVAIKFVFPSIIALAGDNFLQKEAQHLANLEHSNIAKLYSFDTTDNNLPYMVMEYIEGIPIDKYCEDNKLDLSARLKLFQKVCSAVHKAHQNMIVHADIKPSNILIDKQGEPKLMDFGIARTINQTNEDDIKSNKSYLQAASCNFSSPEHFTGDQLSAASDIYSLGKVLEVICISFAKNSELQAIINHACTSNIQGRFSSVLILESSLTALYSHQAILWYRNDLFYHLLKWVKRSPSFAFMSVALVFLIFIGSSLTFIKNNQLNNEAKKNREILSYYEKLLKTTSPSLTSSSMLTAAQLLSYGANIALTSHIEHIETKNRLITTLASSLFNLGYINKAYFLLSKIKIDNKGSLLIKAKLAIAMEEFEKSELLLLNLVNNEQNKFEASLLLARINFNKNEVNTVKKWLNNAKLAEKNSNEKFQRIKFEIELEMATSGTNINSLLNTMSDITDTPLMVLWYKALQAEHYAQQGQFEQANIYISEAITSAEEIYNANHPELAKLYALAASTFKYQKNSISLENYLNKQEAIFRNLSPNFSAQLLTIYQKKFNYYYDSNMYAQARAYNVLAANLCEEHSLIQCEDLLFDYIQISYTLNDYSSVISSAKSWLLEHKANSELAMKFEVLTILARAYIAIDSKEYIPILNSLKSIITDDNQLADYINIQVTTGGSQAMLNEYAAMNFAKMTYSAEVKLALSNAYLSVGNTIAARKILDNIDRVVLSEESKNILEFLTQNKTINKKTLFSTQLQEGVTILKARRVKAVSSPQQDDILKIGEAFSIKWNQKKLPGNKVSIYVNHKKNYDPDGYKLWKNIQKIHWHHAYGNIENNGSFSLDPFYLRANGRRGFKILIVTNLGYWSLSDGLFTIQSGISLDNGLEHNVEQKYLIDVMNKPAAYEVYTIGKQSTIEWNNLRLGGEYVALYILHDDPKNIGNKLYANAKVVKQRRWYMLTYNTKNTGMYTLDPAQFNGQGNNYKILIVSSNGRWAVSDDRFTVINPF